MFMNRPVLIPKAPGKITFQKKGNNDYVLYDVGRRYDANRKYSLKQRTMIGVRIPGSSEMMLPNENYYAHFAKENDEMTQEEQETVQVFTNKWEYGIMLRDFFEQLFFEFQAQSRKEPNGVVNAYKVERLNRILRPLKEIMREEAYASFLEEIPMPEAPNETGPEGITGLTYSDVALMMTQFKGAVNRFFQR